MSSLLPRHPVSRLFLVVLASALPISAAHASRVRPVNLEEITERSERIFSGRCVEVRAAPDPDTGLPLLLATFEVERVVKGTLGERVTVRLLDGRAGGAAATRFEPGERVVLFLYGESRLGLTSPVGMGQGRFRIFTDKRGRDLAINEFGNRDLFRGLSDEAARRIGDAFPDREDRAGVPPDLLLEDVRRLLGASPPDGPTGEGRRTR